MTVCAQTFYWENPESITKADSRFPSSLKVEDSTYLFWQEIDASKKEIWLSCRRYDKVEEFTDFVRFAGPFVYSSDVPDIYSVAYSNSTIAVAVLSGISEISVFSSTDGGVSFEKAVIRTGETSVAPRIYTAHDNSFILFFSENKENEFRISFCSSSDGKKWNAARNFTPTSSMRNPFVPVLCSIDDEELVVFQAQYTNLENNRLSYQLYSTVSKDGGNTWSEPLLLSDKKSLYTNETRKFYAFQNQRPYLYNHEGKVYITWERTDTVNSSIWVAGLNKLEEQKTVEIDSSSVQKISGSGSASRGILFDYLKSLYVVWFDTRRGKESVYLAKKSGNYWDESTLVENDFSNSFAFPLIAENKNGKKSLAFSWQQTTTKNKNSICVLMPDTTVHKPSFNPISFKTGKRSAKKDVSIQIKFPQDSSQIAGYSWTWSKDFPETPLPKIQKFTKENTLKIKAFEDGIYYLTVRVADYAGNWSEPESIAYHLDLTPPSEPVINLDNLDKHGFMKSNTAQLTWQKSPEDDVAGYSYSFEYLGSIPKKLQVSKNHPLRLSDSQVQGEINAIREKYQKNKEKQKKTGSSVMTAGEKSPRYYNIKNGVYAFSVSAIDTVGNVGQSTTELFIFNKFVPRTYISSISQKTDEMGNIVLNITGGGFTYDGTVSQIYLDSDGLEPYDLVLELSQNQYKVVSDSKISQINIDSDLQEGMYKIGLLHTDRGIYFSNDSIQITPTGTIKIESEYVEQKYAPAEKTWKVRVMIFYIIAIVLCIYLLISIIVLMYTYIKDSHDRYITNKEIKALFSGEDMPYTKGKSGKRRMNTVKHKLVRFTYSLVIIVVMIVILQAGYNFINLQERTIAQALQNRIQVLLESIATGTENFFPTNDILELSALPSQKSAMDEVKYITIMGQPAGSNSSENLKYVWASNDPDIENKIDEYRLVYGQSQITDEKIISVLNRFIDIDKNAQSEVGETSQKIDELTRQANALALSTSAEDQQQVENLSQIVMDLRNDMEQRLRILAQKEAGSYPQFNTEELDRSNTDYIFYYPVVYRQGTTNNYIHCVVIAELSTKEVISNLDAETRNIFIFCGVIALAAVIFGAIGAYVFASIIVKPIKKLESHVNLVGHTKNKLDLRGHDVEIKTKDEIGHLGDSINNMVHEMIIVAEEEELALDGKAVQKAFLPLVDSGHNNKNTYAEYKDDVMECFGYYEGESGVSGDYFDYKKLDDEWFVMIKCDASGHGIPAAIIMTVVATIFRRYFASWSYKKNGISLNKLVEQINDFIESLGLKGKFATLIICLLNMKNGELYMCNAGDNLVHIYDGKTRKMKTITLASAPTAGVFSSDLVNMRGGFKVEKTVLNKGDVLFLYTDGIEESTRRIRNQKYEVIQQNVEVKKMNPKTHEEEVEYKTEDSKEEFGTERIEQIIEGVFNRKKFILKKEANPNTTESLEFDFTKGEGSLSEAIFALASIEKVYRMYKKENADTTDYIKIDRKIDEFLKEYFNLYQIYAADRVENPATPNYVDYDRTFEDEQSDDLTMLAIRRL